MTGTDLTVITEARVSAQAVVREALKELAASLLRDCQHPNEWEPTREAYLARDCFQEGLAAAPWAANSHSGAGS